MDYKEYFHCRHGIYSRHNETLSVRNTLLLRDLECWLHSQHKHQNTDAYQLLYTPIAEQTWLQALNLLDY